MPAATTRAVSCPKCRATYQVAGESGAVTCKKCRAVFRVGAAARTTQDKALERARNAGDARTAKRAIIAFAFLGVVLAVIVLSSGDDKPAAPPPPPKWSPHAAETPPTSGTPPVAPKVAKAADSEQEKLARRFVRALATENRAEFDAIFDYRHYFNHVAHVNKWDDARRYERQTPEQQAAMREDTYQRNTAPDRVEHLKRHLVPEMDAGKTVPSEAKVESGSAYFTYDCKGEEGKTAFMLRIHLRPRTDEGAADPASWVVYNVAEQWLTTSVGRPKRDRDFRSAEDRKKEEEVAARVANPSGLPEEAPVAQAPLTGTSTAQADAIRAAVKTMLDPEASGPQVARARMNIQEAGKVAIPFLLNELVGKDHRVNEEDRKNSAVVVRELIEITGEQIAYGPMNSDQPAFGMLQMTPEEREQSVRRWFGWWKTKGPKFEKKITPPEPEDEAERPASPPPKPPKR
ncbi:MAG TPA: hypothetical protein VEI02_01040 [Planctomycetota bacterium]|nr:hypothetical protein [Planctomycetota bacterium]